MTFWRHAQTEELLDKLARKGVKLYPGSARLNFFAGLAEMAKSLAKPPLRLRRLRQFEKALQIAETSSVPGEVEFLPAIRKMLTMFKELQTQMGRSSFGGGPIRTGILTILTTMTGMKTTCSTMNLIPRGRVFPTRNSEEEKVQNTVSRDGRPL